MIQQENLEKFAEMIGKNRPILFKDALAKWTGFKEWEMNNDLILQEMADSVVTVACTPDGYADAIKKHNEQLIFTLPDEQEMAFKVFWDKLRNNSNSNSVKYYVQSQCDNLSSDFKRLSSRMPIDIFEQLASELLGDAIQPEASNVWIGSDSSITSLHKDYYDNLYAVLRGTKQFYLLKPSYPIECSAYPTWRCAMRDNKDTFDLVDCETKTHWYTEPEDLLQTAELITVQAGDVLYLPSGYYHHVRQCGDVCIAFNSWYNTD